MDTIFVIVFSFLIGSSYQEAGWSYDYETQWPGACRTGERQSPINIMTRDAILDKHEAHLRGPLRMRGYRSVNVTALNNGHTLKWNVADDLESAPRLSGGPLRGNYSLVQFHFHWLSEHAIDGMKYPLEIHFVHVKTGLKLAEAVNHPDGLAVIGVFAQVHSRSWQSETALSEIIPVVPALTIPAKSEKYTTIDVTRLFSPEPQSYYTYHGSLTTPNCDEIVTWIVMDKPIAISDDQYKLFNKVDVGGTVNYRSLQPTTGRVVYRSMASCSSALTPGLLGFLVALISCLTSNLASMLGNGLCVIYNMKKKLVGSILRECGKVGIN